MKVERSSLDQVKERFNKNKRKAEEKKDEPTYDLQNQLKNAAQAEAERREQRKRKKKSQLDDEGGRGHEEDDMARLMGFGGFGGSKKNN